MLQISKKFRTFTRIIVVTCIALLLLLTGFEALPLTHYGTDYLSNAGYQRVRSQTLLKSALILEYRPLAEHSQAISDMQIVLPLLIQEQNVLANNPNADIQQRVQEARPDFLAMVSAAQKILAHPDKPVDPVQIDILITHDRPFLATELLIINLIVSHEEAAQVYLFVVEFILDLILLILGISFLLVFELMLRRQQQNQDQTGGVQ